MIKNRKKIKKPIKKKQVPIIIPTIKKRKHRRLVNDSKNITVIVPAAGIGKRFGGNIPKQYVEIKDHPILYYILNKYQNIERVNNIVLVVHRKYIDKARSIINNYNFPKKIHVVIGGDERFNSVENAYNFIKNNLDNIGHIIIHDVNRPLVKIEQIQRLIENSRKNSYVGFKIELMHSLGKCDKNGYLIEVKSRTAFIETHDPCIISYPLFQRMYSLDSSIKKSLSYNLVLYARKFGVRPLLINGDRLSLLKITYKEDYYIALHYL